MGLEKWGKVAKGPEVNSREEHQGRIIRMVPGPRQTRQETLGEVGGGRGTRIITPIKPPRCMGSMVRVCPARSLAMNGKVRGGDLELVTVRSSTNGIWAPTRTAKKGAGRRSNPRPGAAGPGHSQEKNGPREDR